MAEPVRIERLDAVATVILDRPGVRNAVDPATAAALATAFLALDAEPGIHAIVLWGAGGTFCAGADLRAVADGWDSGDLRIAEVDAVFGVFCRRWGVPLIDGGTVRLPRVVGQGRALDMILTGRPVGADEARAAAVASISDAGR